MLNLYSTLIFDGYLIVDAFLPLNTSLKFWWVKPVFYPSIWRRGRILATPGWPQGGTTLQHRNHQRDTEMGTGTQPWHVFRVGVGDGSGPLLDGTDDLSHKVWWFMKNFSWFVSWFLHISPDLWIFMDQLRHVTTILMASDVPIDPLALGFQRLRRIGRHQDRYSEIVLCLKCGPEIGLFPPVMAI